MRLITKKQVSVILGILIFITILFSNRIVIGNELYVKIIPETIYFALQHRDLNKELLKEYKKIKEKYHYANLVFAENDYILYADLVGYLRVLKYQNGTVTDEEYVPKLTCSIDGNYIEFTIDDDLIRYADSYQVDMYVDNEYGESFHLPVGFCLGDSCRVIKKTSKQYDDLSKAEFRVSKVCRNGKFWTKDFRLAPFIW